LTTAERVAALCGVDLEVYSHPIEAALRSPFAQENALAEELGPLRGPHLLAGRLAAHAAIAALPDEPAPLLRADSGEVAWPAPLVGAIAHTPDLAVAIVGRSARYAGAGVDVERRTRTLDEGTARLVARDEERIWLARPPRDLDMDALVALTSAKEVVFKAYFPATRIRLRFADAVVRPVHGGFRAEVLRTDATEDKRLPATMDIARALLGDYVVLAGALPRA